jgi:two-component system cell cycle sensor histidine kinase/response regulator CckA
VERSEFEEILERLPLVVYKDELDGRSSARWVTAQIEPLLGYTREEWLGDPDLFVDSLHEDDRARVLADIARRNETGQNSSAEYRLVRRDGSVVWVHDEEVVVRDAEGRPHHVEGYLQDVTAQRHDRERPELIARILALAADEVSGECLIAETAEVLAAAVGDVTVTFVELTSDGRVLPRYTTSEHGLPAALPRIPEAWHRLEHGPLVVEDVLLEPWLEPNWPVLARRGVRSAVDVPILRNGEIASILWFNTAEPRRWTPYEVQTLTEAANQLGIVLERAEAREQRERAAAELRARDAILASVMASAQRLLAEPTWLAAAPDLLARIGTSVGASRAYVFENGHDEEGRLVTSQRCEWVAPGIAPEIDNPLLQELDLDAVGLSRFVEVVGSNRLYAGAVSELPEGERAIFEEQQILSIMTVPIFVGSDWWGFIGFDDCVTARTWTPAETDALRTAASLVAAAIRRERSEAILREHEQKLRAVFDTALDAIFITDDGRRIVDVNPAACELLAVAKRDLIGHSTDEFMTVEQRSGIEAFWEGLRSGSGDGLAEWQALRADGELRHVEASVRPGFLPGLNIAFVRDVTEKKRLESELLSAQKLDSIGRLAGGVAHDFNNLLTAIGGYTSLLLERAGGDAALAHDLGEIKRATDRAGELTRQLLAFARRQMLQPRVVDLNEILAGAGSLLGRLLGEHVELALQPSARPATVRADPGQLEQVIINLAVNARDAMPDGGRLDLAVRETDEHVELVAADTGVGMDRETLDQVFEPFFTTREEGVGLGLASVYGIVRQSGGDVVVESQPGRGSTFVVRLPRVDAAPAAEERETAAETRAGEETILLVEDEDVVRALAHRVLERCGYTVLACADGAEAIDLADRHPEPIDLLLTDVVMPGLRGPEVAERVSASRPGIKVLYMSGYADEALLGAAAIGDALIEKPFGVDALARRVREALEPEAAPESARMPATRA